jgi:hypothetical protein
MTKEILMKMLVRLQIRTSDVDILAKAKEKVTDATNAHG